MTLVWSLLGLALIVIEIFTPSLGLIFFGLAALVVSAATLFGLEDVPSEIFIFTVLGTASLLLFRKRLKEGLMRGKADGFDADRKSAFRLSAPIRAREEAYVSYQGTMWTAVNDTDADLAEGTRVVVIRSEGIKIHVKPTND